MAFKHESAGSSEYTMVSGDSLAAIAASHGLSLTQLLAANPQMSNPDLIQAGQTITIPAAGQQVAWDMQGNLGFMTCLHAPRALGDPSILSRPKSEVLMFHNYHNAGRESPTPNCQSASFQGQYSHKIFSNLQEYLPSHQASQHQLLPFNLQV